jgi:hypothetical protein
MFKWIPDEHAFENIRNKKRLDVQNAKNVEGQNVDVQKANGSKAQEWNVEYANKAVKVKTEGMSDYGFMINKPFYIKSRMTFGRVLWSTNGSDIRINRWLSKDDRQLWVFDNMSKTIKSKKWPNKSISFHGHWFYLRPTNSRHFQMWKYVNNANIQGIKDKRVMDVNGFRDKDGTQCRMHKLHNKINQQWDIVYADQWKPDPKKGELNTVFNLVVERPFYVVSALQSGKYLDLISRNMVIKTRNGRDSQLWYFDQRTLTIKNKQHSGWSWDIHGAGRHTNM